MGEYYLLKEVSVTVHINVISYVLICWAYYGPLALSLLTPQQLLLKMKLDLDPTMKMWYNLLYYMMGGHKYEIKCSNMIYMI